MIFVISFPAICKYQQNGGKRSHPVQQQITAYSFIFYSLIITCRVNIHAPGNLNWL